MVDLQTHILPGLDEGAPNDRVATEICAAAAQVGVREIVATPDCDPKFEFDRKNIDARAKALEERLGGAVHLHTGAVLKISHDSFGDALADLSRYSINSRRYLLMRPTGSSLARGVANLFRAVRTVGFTGIVSLPETSAAMRSDMKRLRHWVRGGTLIAVGGDSLFGYNGPRAEECALALLDAGLAHFIVSDARTVRRRRGAFDDVYNFAVYRWGEDRARRLLIDHPWAVLWGQRFEHSVQGQLRKRFSLRKALGLSARR